MELFSFFFTVTILTSARHATRNTNWPWRLIKLMIFATRYRMADVSFQ